MANPIRQLLSQTSYVADGVSTVWNFSFSGGYLDKSHVKAKYLDAMRVEHQLAVSPAMFIGDYQLSITPPVAEGYELTIYRDTPKNLPLVDFIDAASLTEASLDLSAKQGVFVAAESSDLLVTTIASTDQIQEQLNNAQMYAAQAAVSRTSALDTLNEFKGRIYGPLAANPTVDPLGNAIGEGDEYFNTVSQTRMVYRTGGWLDFELIAKGYADAAQVSELAANADAAAALVSQQGAYASASGAIDAKNVALAARDATLTAGKVFTSTDAGIAGTTNGYSFSVLSDDLLDLIVYLNSNGTAVEYTRFATKAFLNSLGFDVTYAARLGYACAFIDSTGAMAIGITNTGAVVFGRGGDIHGRLVSVEALLASSASSAMQTYYDRGEYSVAYLDQLGNLAGGLNRAGDLISKGVNVNQALLGGKGYERSGVAWGITDEAGAYPLAIDMAGNVLIKGVDAGPALTKWITPSGFACFGDSLTRGASGIPYPTQLAALLGKAVTNGGVSGQRAVNIDGRFGGSTVLVTVKNNTIPASGDVEVVDQTFHLHYKKGPVGGVLGTLGGIPGRLFATAFDAHEVPTAVHFTRTTAGNAKVIEGATPFIVDTSDNRQFNTLVFWYGRNDVGYSTFQADVLKATAASISVLKPIEKRFVVMSVLNSNAETVGTGTYLSICATNDALKAAYPRNFLDIRAILVRSGTGTGQDAIDAANDVVPSSLRVDAIHLNTAGYAVVANAVYNFFILNGWLT